MKNTFAIIFCLLFALTSYCQKDSIRGKQYQLTGKIIGKVQLAPPCGYIAFATVLEFEVTKLRGMTYKNKNLGIIITCPDMYGQTFFKKGKLYQVVFSDTNQADFGWSIANHDLLKKNNLSFDPYAVLVKQVE